MNQSKITSVSSVIIAIKDFFLTLKNFILHKQVNKNQTPVSSNKLPSSGSEPRTQKERITAAVIKSNEANKERLIAEINRSGEIDSVYDKLLPEYSAYKNLELKDVMFTPVSSDTVNASYKGKSIEIRFYDLNDGNKLQEIKFEDGSQIGYITYINGGKIKINEEEFEMPAGTVVETKTVKIDKGSRVFSQFIQIPDAQRKVINKPEYIDIAEQALKAYDPAQFHSEHEVMTASDSAVMPTPEYMLNLLGKANSARALLELSKNTSRTPIDEINYLKKCISEGSLPQSTSITGVKEDGGKIITIQGENCKYEVCGSELRVIDNYGEIKMITRYESGRELDGLWIIMYDNEKPISGIHYVSWDLNKPQFTVNYTYDNNTVTAAITTANGNKTSVKQILPDCFYLDIENKEFKFVSSDKSHLGLIFENQTPFINPIK